jgi:hypothetical protein
VVQPRHATKLPARHRDRADLPAQLPHRGHRAAASGSNTRLCRHRPLADRPTNRRSRPPHR